MQVEHASMQRQVEQMMLQCNIVMLLMSGLAPDHAYGKAGLQDSTQTCCQAG